MFLKTVEMNDQAKHFEQSFGVLKELLAHRCMTSKSEVYFVLEFLHSYLSGQSSIIAVPNRIRDCLNAVSAARQAQNARQFRAR